MTRHLPAEIRFFFHFVFSTIPPLLILIWLLRASSLYVSLCLYAFVRWLCSQPSFRSASFCKAAVVHQYFSGTLFLAHPLTVTCLKPYCVVSVTPSELWRDSLWGAILELLIHLTAHCLATNSSFFWSLSVEMQYLPFLPQEGEARAIFISH